MKDIILIGAVMIASFAGLFRPIIGLLTFVFLGVFSPHSFAWGVASTFPLSQMVAVTTLLGTLVSVELRRFRPARETLLLLLLWLIFGISTYFANAPELAVEKLIYVSKVLLMVVLTTILVNNQYRLQWLLRIIALSLGFYAVKAAVFAILTGGQYLVYGPERSFLAANNAIGLALAMNIPILIHLIKLENNRLLTWLMKVMVVSSYPAIICTYSRGAWLGMAVATGVVFLKARHKFIIIFSSAVLVVLLLPALPLLMPERVVGRYDTLINYDKDESAQSRLWNWEFCKRVGISNPLTGAGFDYYSLQAYSVYYSEFLERFPGKVWSCHSIWLTILSEHGFVGMFVWAALIASMFSSIRQIRASALVRPKDAWAGQYANMIQQALIAFLVLGTFLDAAYFDLFYYLIAMLVTVKRIIAESAVDLSPTSVAEIQLAGQFARQGAPAR